MKIIKNIDQQLLSHINALNTVNGGMAAPEMNYEKVENGYLFSVYVPNTPESHLKAEVVNNKLFVYQLVNTEGDTGPNTRILGKIPINFDIDIPAMSSFYEDETLFVNFPFNDMKGGYRKKLTL